MWGVRAATTTGGIACALLGLAAACRQIVGIGDEPPVDRVDAGVEAGPACGIAYAGDKCEVCLESNCCNLARECAGSTACSTLETCLGACSGDPTCRARCTYKNLIGPDENEDQLAACLVASCAKDCHLVCGGVAQFYGPDAAAGCQSCTVDNTCAAATACASDPECIANMRCVIANYLPDRQQACQTPHDAGAEAFAAFSNAELTSCAPSCSIGAQWECLGRTAIPEWSSPTLATVNLLAGQIHTPLTGASITLCADTDVVCDAGLYSTTTDDAGSAVLRVAPATGPQPMGAAGYAQVTAPGTYPAIVYWGFPFSEPTYTAPPAPLLTSIEVGLLAGATHVTFDPNFGVIVANPPDCTWMWGAAGVSFSLSSSIPGKTAIVYDIGGTFSTAATNTGSGGQVFIYNVPPGLTTVTATPVGLGPSSQLSVVTRAGWVTYVFMVPNR